MLVRLKLLEQPVDAVLGTDTLRHEAEPGAHQIPQAALLGADHVGDGDEIGAQQQG